MTSKSIRLLQIKATTTTKLGIKWTISFLNNISWANLYPTPKQISLSKSFKLCYRKGVKAQRKFSHGNEHFIILYSLVVLSF